MIKVPSIWHEPVQTGYTPKTNYWVKFTDIEMKAETEQDAIKALKPLVTQLKRQSRGKVEKVAELVMVVNHKCWKHANLNQNILGLWYSDLYHKLHNWAWNQKWTDIESSYLFDALD